MTLSTYKMHVCVYLNETFTLYLISQVDAAEVVFKSKTSTNELKFQKFCLGWSGNDLKRTDRIAEKPSLLCARMQQVLF